MRPPFNWRFQEVFPRLFLFRENIYNSAEGRTQRGAERSEGVLYCYGNGWKVSGWPGVLAASDLVADGSAATTARG